MTLYILNTLITPINFDFFENVNINMRKITVEEAKEIIKQHGNAFVSAVGHESTAKVLSQLLGIEIPAKRQTIFMNDGDEAIHFFLKQRLPEGKILTEQELTKLEFWLVHSIIKRGEQ